LGGVATAGRRSARSPALHGSPTAPAGAPQRSRPGGSATADEQRLGGSAGEGEPLVPGLVALLDGPCRRDLAAEPFPGGLPGVGRRDPLCAVFVSCQLPELLELRHGSLRVEDHSASLSTMLEPSGGVSLS